MPRTPREGGGAVPGRTPSKIRVGHGLEGWGGEGREPMGMLQAELEDAREQLRTQHQAIMQLQLENARMQETVGASARASTLSAPRFDPEAPLVSQVLYTELKHSIALTKPLVSSAPRFDPEAPLVSQFPLVGMNSDNWSMVL